MKDFSTTHTARLNLEQRIPAAMGNLFPKARRNGNTYRLGSVSGEAGSSLAIDATTGLWLDHATGQKGDFIDLWQAAKGCGFRQALQEISDAVGGCDVAPVKAPERTEKRLERRDWTRYLHKPQPDEIKQISRLLEIGTEGLNLAVERGHLWTMGKHFVITDSARYTRADRMIDGSLVKLRDGGETKTRTLGPAPWPIGSHELEKFDFCILAEGVSDFLAAHHLIAAEDVREAFCAVAMLGSSQRIHPDALECFSGKNILMFPDMDLAGNRGGKQWESQLRTVARTVWNYDFTGMMRQNGQPVQDLRDFLQIAVNQWEERPEIRHCLSIFIGQLHDRITI